MTALEFKFKNLKDKIYNSNKLKERKGTKLVILFKSKDHILKLTFHICERN